MPAAKSPLHAKIAKIRAEFGSITKTGENKGVGRGYKFVEATEVAGRWNEAASDVGITMVPVSQKILDIRETSSGKQTVYSIETEWLVTDSESGESVLVVGLGQGADNADKALPKAQTNSMKYAILLLLQLAGDDPEKDEDVDRRESQGRRRPAGRAARNRDQDEEEERPSRRERPEPDEDNVEEASAAKKRKIRAVAREVGLDDGELKALAFWATGKRSSRQYTDSDADRVLAVLADGAVVDRFRDMDPYDGPEPESAAGGD